LNPQTQTTPQTPIYLTDQQVQSILTPQMAYEGVVDGLTAHAKGEFIQPLKPYIRPRGREDEYNGGRFITMPAYVGGGVQMAGVKWIAGFPANIDRGLPRASGMIIVSDVETGAPLAVMDCATVSAMRTAAIAALSIDRLAPTGQRRVGIFGAGPIARATLRALGDRNRGISEIRIYDLRRDRAEKLAAERFEGLPCDIQVGEDAEQTVRSSNVIITSTTGGKGWLPPQWMTPPWLLVALSLDDAQPEVLLGADKVICDDFDQCNREEKMFQHLVDQGRLKQEDIYAELGQVVTGDKPGREGDETIYVNPMGMAVEDIGVAARVYRAAAGQAEA